ncbi:uncharacterized protein SOCG_01983 [Schizosaccharomyces octosporus yFS286]|uniref:Uncharacterized protein n=1 Tax=Schizosaccharomyces octosporus (strain yFS286) TaxID=483514 RepID=S9RKJ8_SCHOY|nr:uncharacterized protein SOCG_01983 [Schizosaccharomyces octosporus yFS286]EPX74499.1 hypothetical protein SOCG_01983 [Schizosaccharomyces octosporus yFS286]
MKNNYAPVSDSDDSFKVLNDEKSDARSLDGTGTPPPYSAPNKFIDLEMADGSTQHSAQESTNNAGSDSTYSKWIRIAIFFFCIFCSRICSKEWFKQIGRVLSNMCAAVLCTASLNVPCYSVYYFVKKVIGFEKMDKGFFYFVCIVNVAVFVLFWSTTDTRQLRIFIADLGNGMGSMVNGMGNIGNGIRDASNYIRPTDLANEAPRNEEIELQPLAEQSAEV